MELKQHNLNDFIHILASDTPTPGGGSVSALAGAVGAALTEMVARLTLGREKYEEYEDLVQGVAAHAVTLRALLVSAIDKDAASYKAVSDTFSMPKSTDEEKTARREAMQLALKAAVEPPFEIMGLGLAVLECADKLIGRSNINAVSDLGVAALNLKSAMQGAWLNVLINLGSITDKNFSEEYHKRGAEILETGINLADKIYSDVLYGLESQ